MKKKLLIGITMLLCVMLLFTGCPKINEPGNDGGSGTPTGNSTGGSGAGSGAGSGSGTGGSGSSGNGTGGAGGSCSYDTSVYNIPMSQAITDSRDFIEASIMDGTVSRAAFAVPGNADKWQGYINSLWNVPSSVYGTDLDVAKNELVIHGDESVGNKSINLGKLQNLVHHKDENGNYTKAVFEYKGHLYYVIDKEELTGNSNDSYIVLCSDEEYEHIIFDQEGHIGQSDFFNFKIWQWEQTSSGEYYRWGNLGYAYTLQNVQMLDGSYATVTVSGYGYYDYGFRVWIKQTNGKKGNETLPVMGGGDNDWVNPDNVPETLGNHLITGDNYDFIYEVKNEFGEEFRIKNYIRVRKVENYELKEYYIAATEWITVPVDGNVEMKYSIDDLEAAYSGYEDIILGCFFNKDGNWSGGWENMIENRYKYNKHSVKLIPTFDGYWFDGVNSWDLLISGEYIELDLSGHAADLATCSFLDIYRKESTESNSCWKSIMNYFSDGNASVDTNVILTDYYAEPGKTYNYQIRYWDSSIQQNIEIDLGTYTAINGVGDLEVIAGAAVVNANAKTLSFTTVPTHTPEIEIGYDPMLAISYSTFDNEPRAQLIFYMHRLTNNAISIDDAFEDSWNNNPIAGRTFYPYCYEFRVGRDIGNNCWVNHHAYLNIESGDTSLPAITVSADGRSYTDAQNARPQNNGGGNNYLNLDYEGDFIELDLSQYADQLAGMDWLNIYRKGGSSDYFEQVINYEPADRSNPDYSNVIITDYFIEPNTSYEYEICWWDENEQENKSISLGTYSASDGVGEMTITPGAAIYNTTENRLEFTTLPSFGPEEVKDNEWNFYLSYWHPDNNYEDNVDDSASLSIWLGNLDENNNTISLSDIIDWNKNNNRSIWGKVFSADALTVHIQGYLENGEWIRYKRQIYQNELSFPEITIPLE